MFKYIILIALIFFTACSTKTIEKAQIERNETIREYANISKDAVFQAAKKVFLFAGKNEFRIDSYRDKLIVSKTKMSHYPFYVVTHEDFWNLYIEEENNISKARLSLHRVVDYDEENPEYLSKDFHNILWNRVEYLLGLSDTWQNCGLSSREFYGALCDSVDMTNPKMPKKEDIVKDILIIDRKSSKSLNDIDEDILKEDIELSIDESNDDLLKKEDTLDSNIEENNQNEKLDDSFDKEIKELEKKVNKNIDETLDKIEKSKEDEIIEEPSK